jgi:copper chaperone
VDTTTGQAGGVDEVGGPAEGMATVVVSVPEMSSRHDLRQISGYLCELPGVVAVEVDLEAKTVRVLGDVAAQSVGAAITEAGFEAVS